MPNFPSDSHNSPSPLEIETHSFGILNELEQVFSLSVEELLAESDQEVRARRIELLRPIFEYIRDNGNMPSGITYMAHNKWKEIVESPEYTVARDVNAVFKSTIIRILDKIPEDSDVEFVVLGAGNGFDGYSLLEAMKKERPNAKVDLYLVDQNLLGLTTAANALNDPESPYYISETKVRPRIMAVHADFTANSIDEVVSKSRTRVDQVLTRPKVRVVVFKGITSGNLNDFELFKALNLYTRIADHVYIDSAVRDNIDGLTLDDIAQILSNYSSEQAKDFILTNWVKIVAILGLDVTFADHLDRTDVVFEKTSDGYAVKFMYEMGQELNAIIMQHYGIDLVELICLYMSKRRDVVGFQRILRDNNFKPDSMLNNNEVGGYLLQRN